MDLVSNLYRANEVYIFGSDTQDKRQQRLDLQHAAWVDLKLLGYLSQLALEQGCILSKQFEQIAKGVFDCQNLLGARINSDNKRLMPQG